MTSFFRKLSWLARRRRKEAELEEELQFHLARKQNNIRWKDCWGWTYLEQLGRDLRYAFRTMASNRL